MKLFAVQFFDSLDWDWKSALLFLEDESAIWETLKKEGYLVKRDADGFYEPRVVEVIGKQVLYIQSHGLGTMDDLLSVDLELRDRGVL